MADDLHESHEVAEGFHAAKTKATRVNSLQRCLLRFFPRQDVNPAGDLVLCFTVATLLSILLSGQ
jgi:hypothetical protein